MTLSTNFLMLNKEELIPLSELTVLVMIFFLSDDQIHRCNNPNVTAC